MRRGKPLILVLFIIIIIGVAAYLLLFTDKFKTSKEDKFFENLSKIDIAKYINLDEYNNYYKNLKTSKYTAKQTVELEGTKEDKTYTNELVLKKVVNNEENKKSAAITVKEDDESLIKMTYLKNDDLHGIKIDDVISQYIVVENENVQKFVNKFGIKTNTNIPEKIKNIDLSVLPTNEEFTTLYSGYLEIIKNNVSKDSYQKINKKEIELEGKTISASGYKLVLEDQEFKDVLQKILENAENDNTLYNIVNNLNINMEELSYIKYQDNIKNIIDEITQNSGKLELALYLDKEELVKCSLDITVAEKTNSYAIEFVSDKIILKVDKLNTNENEEENLEITKDLYQSGIANWNISYIKTKNKAEIWNVSVNLLRNGQLTSKSIKYITEIDLKNDNLNLKINSNNSLTFQNEVEEIETFSEDNCALINGVNKEQLAILTNGLKEILADYIDIENSAVGVAEQVLFNVYEIVKDN